YLNDPVIISAMNKIRLEILAEVPEQEGNRFNSSRVVADFGSNDDVAVAICNSPRGTFRNPLTADDLADKFRTLSFGRIDSSRIERLIDGFIHHEEFEIPKQDLLSDLWQSLQNLSEKNDY